ncbi:MAG: hypothetical protein ACKVQC_07200 [Elusimicrobiota bacterium]
MITFVLLIIVFCLVASNIALWKYGFIHDAEKPIVIEDKPISDPKERKTFLKRLRRWKEEGRITREEFERIGQLCESEWDIN